MSVNENFNATWQKRFMQKHYSYRDFHTVSPTAMAEGTMLLLIAAGLGASPSVVNPLVYYVFGTNARLAVNPLTLPWGTVYGTVAWPLFCYGREVKVMCTEDAYIKIVSANPTYIKETLLNIYTAVPVSATPLIFEEEQSIPEDEEITFFPTYGYGITFRTPVGGDAGTLYVWCEGNVEGGE